MITGFTILNVEGKIDSTDALARQRFPRLNISLDKVSADGEKIKIDYSFIADYMDGEGKEAKNLGQLKLSGIVEVKDTKESVTSVMKKWNDSKMLPVQLAEEVINGLNFRCSATGTLIAYSLGLIPPLVISQTRIQEEKTK